jgi:hypothetical protein
VPLLIRERQQDMKHRGRQRQPRLWLLFRQLYRLTLYRAAT